MKDLIASIASSDGSDYLITIDMFQGTIDPVPSIYRGPEQRNCPAWILVHLYLNKKIFTKTKFKIMKASDGQS
jgi:hypothetical protein